MTSRSATDRPWLVGALRVAAALTVIGSTVAATVLTVGDGDPVAVVVTQETVPAARAAPPAPAEPSPEAVPAAPPPPAAEAPAASVPLGTGGAAPAGSVPLAAPAPGGPASSVPLGPGANVPAGPGDSVRLAPGADLFAAPQATQPPCPLGWPAPRQQGGLASLIGLAPLAGPFSSEAFALGAVYQPILQLVGPVLAEIAPVISAHQPLIDPFIAQVQAVELVVLEAILPYYGPYRDQLIAAEGEFAKVLAPILNNVYNSEVASCFVAWQGQIIEQAKGGPIRVASLARPGTVVELGPAS